MSTMYTDYVNRTALTLPDKFIDVKTGDTCAISQKVEEQIAYHARNNTLIHLVLSALNQYLHPKEIKGGNEQILLELNEIKKLIQNGYVPRSTFVTRSEQQRQTEINDLDLQEVEDVLEAFGG